MGHQRICMLLLMAVSGKFVGAARSLRAAAAAGRRGWHLRRLAPPFNPSFAHLQALPSGSSPDFLTQVEITVDRVFAAYPPAIDILEVPIEERQSVGVARSLHKRLTAFRVDHNNCPRCWLQRAHCVCSECPPLEQEVRANSQNERAVSPLAQLGIRRIFLLVHHKEICLVVDTAKLILAAFPESCRLVVAGIGPDYQDSVKEMEEATSAPSQGSHKVLVLFPEDEAKTFAEVYDNITSSGDTSEQPIDLIVFDGTWEQARRMHRRYLSAKPCASIQLNESSVLSVSAAQSNEDRSIQGRQLRRHPQQWREISTLAAVRLLLSEMKPDAQFDVLARYQSIADGAARRQLGGVRPRGAGVSKPIIPGSR